LAEAKKNADAVENAKITGKASAEAKWRVTVDQEIDALIHEWAEKYAENFCILHAAGFDKFFDGKNGPDDKDYELAKDEGKEELGKKLKVGEDGGFEAFAQELGFKLLPRVLFLLRLLAEQGFLFGLKFRLLLENPLHLLCQHGGRNRTSRSSVDAMRCDLQVGFLRSWSMASGRTLIGKMKRNGHTSTSTVSR